MLADSTETAFRYKFSNGQIAYVLDVPDDFSYTGSLNALGLTTPCPSMVVIGGAGYMSRDSQKRVSKIFTEVLAPIAEIYGITVFDGGTDAGIIQMMGQARYHIDGQFNLVGVAPKAKVHLPNHKLNLAVDIADIKLSDLEEHHTHFALIPGLTWGHESRWLANFASKLSTHYPSITVLINGGKISLTDLMINLSVGQQTIIVAGSGRLADEIANTINGTKKSENSIIQDLVKTYYPSQLTVFELSNSLNILTDRLHSHFNPQLAA